MDTTVIFVLNEPIMAVEGSIWLEAGQYRGVRFLDNNRLLITTGISSKNRPIYTIVSIGKGMITDRATD